jgi:uncharacterized protein YciI
MRELIEDIEKIIEPNLRKRFHVAFYSLVAPEAEVVAHIPEHLHYMEQIEEEVFLSGPLVVEGHLVGEGMTIFRSADKDKVQALLANEPFIRRGLRRYTLKQWEVREGTLTVQTTLTGSKFQLL